MPAGLGWILSADIPELAGSVVWCHQNPGRAADDGRQEGVQSSPVRQKLQLPLLSQSGDE